MTMEDLVAISAGATISVPEPTLAHVAYCRKVIDEIIEAEKPVYGINTGFGLLSHTNVDNADLNKLQLNLIRSHASGVGEPLDTTTVRRIMALRINVLARGHSGISLGVLETLIRIFNAGLTPEVPCQGTVGASGDLAPLAHIALGCIGEGAMRDPSRGHGFFPAGEVLQAHGIAPAQLRAKDGLAMVNGTQFITGVGSQALEGALVAAQVAQPITALTLVALNGFTAAFDERVHEVCRPHPGSAVVAHCLRLLAPPGDHDETNQDVQDCYSLRCAPAVHGPALEILAQVRESLELEMNCSTDNPLIFADGGRTGAARVVSAGNFHGEYPAKALDTLALYVGELGRASAARVMLMADPNRNRTLPAFLASDAGLDSGFMCWELTAAALDAENRTLSMPASCETNITGAGKEDHVSMGGFAARKAVQVVENTAKIQAIELLMATHAVHHRRKRDASFRMPSRLEKLYHLVGEMSTPMETDRFLGPDYKRILNFMTGDMAKSPEFVNPL
jgi:histidine ammonia-lyase